MSKRSKETKEKSAHLSDLEATFDRHTRRFSPFEILGLRVSEDKQDENSSPAIRDNRLSTHTGVDATHPHVDTTHPPDSSTPIPEEGIHTRVVVSRSNNIPSCNDPPTEGWMSTTHMGVDATPPPPVSGSSKGFPKVTAGEVITKSPKEDWTVKHSQTAQMDMRMHDVLAATHLRSQLGTKARQVLDYLNTIRSIERPAYTVPVGYAQISAAADVHPHYLRRNVLPKLMMLGLIGIVHKGLQGTIYHLHYDTTFISIVAGGEEVPPTSASLVGFASGSQHNSQPAEAQEDLPLWIDREHWGWLAPEAVHQLVAKAGSEAQALEKLAIILYNETHGPQEKRVRDRRAVLAHYLRTPQADIWPNDDGFETLAIRRARQERDRALQEKALAEETLRARQETAKVRFLASLDEGQLRWLKQEAKRRVDARPESQFLSSRYPLYKAEEEQAILEWMDRVDYGEHVPHVSTDSDVLTAEDVNS